MADGQLIATMAPTGRKLAGPALDVIEVAGPNSLKHQAFVFHEQWRGHPLLTTALQPRLTFMERPEVSGLARLAAHDLSGGAFAYATGAVWTLAEIVRVYADNGTAPGVKAGLELCYLVGEMLSEAADAASSHGMIGHGNINPWTISLKGDGQPVIAAYGLPQVELLAWKENNRLQIGEDSFRYAPPERIETGEDEFSSDLFSLALVSLELMVGRPVYDGVLADVKQQASRGEGMRRLYQWREKLPQNVREVMGRALKPDPDTRFSSALELVYAVHDLLGSIDVDGPSLLEVMAKVRASEKRGRALKGGQTQLLTPEEMAELAADLQEIDQAPLPPPRRPRPDEVEAPGVEKPRWSKPVRRADPAASAPASPPRASGGSARPAPQAVPQAAPQAAPPPPISSPVDRPRRRLASESSGAFPAIPAGDSDRSGEKERLRRRLRGTNLSPEELSAPDDVQLEPVVEKRPPDNKRPEEQLAAPKRFDGVAPTLQTGRAPPPTLMAFLPPEGDSKPAASPPARPRAEATTPVARLPEPEPSAAVPASPPSIARTDNTPPDGTNGKSAAAALLERLRTSGDRRRRLRSTADDPGLPSTVSQAPPLPSPAPSSLRQSPSLASAPSPSAVPPGSVTAPQRAPTSAAPTSTVPAPSAPVPGAPAPGAPAPSAPAPSAPGPVASGPVAPPPPIGLSTRTIAPTANTPSTSPTRTVDVRLIARTLPIPLRDRERVASLTLRAATELGAWRVDPSGRMFGGFRLERAGVALPSDSLVPAPEPGSPPLDLVPVRPETRMIEVRVLPRSGEPIRLRTPLELTLPCRWVVNGLVTWLGLPDGDWAARLSGERFDGDRPAGEALSSDLLEIYEF